MESECFICIKSIAIVWPLALRLRLHRTIRCTHSNDSHGCQTRTSETVPFQAYWQVTRSLENDLSVIQYTRIRRALLRVPLMRASLSIAVNIHGDMGSNTLPFFREETSYVSKLYCNSGIIFDGMGETAVQFTDYPNFCGKFKTFG